MKNCVLYKTFLLSSIFFLYTHISNAADKSKYPCSGPDKDKCEFCYDDEGGVWNTKTRKCDVNSQMVFGKDVGIPQKQPQTVDKNKDKDNAKDNKDKNSAKPKNKKGKAKDKKKEK